jgi:ABC-type cobalt transport system substrate-binding protein
MSTMKKVVTLFLVALLIIIAVYLVRQNPTGSDDLHSQQIEAADPRQEELFRACVAERDREIHRRIFATIDNPDVQREILATEKERAVRECREELQ